MPLRLASPDGAARPLQSSHQSSGWQQGRRSAASDNGYLSSGSATSFRDKVIRQGEMLNRKIMKTLQKMSLWQKIAAAVALVTVGVLGLLFLIFNERIFHWLEPYAEKWKHTTGGWTILWALTFIAAFPPMIGYSTCGTLAGFVYGIGEGWIILATATVAGSFCSFIVSRTILRSYAERMVSNDRRFAALALTLKQDGLKLLCMIRLCPLPYSISNGAMSTFPTVEPQMYALATALITPKLFIHVFIGDRLAYIARTGGELSIGAKLLNYLSIVLFGTIGAVTGYIIYRKTMAKAHELENQEAEAVRDSVSRTGTIPAIFTDDPEAQTAAETVAQDDDAVAYFDDTPSPKPPYDDSQSDVDVFDERAGNAIGLQRK